MPKSVVSISAGEIGHQRLDVVDAVIDDADRTRGEPAVAAGFIFGRSFQHDDFGALLLRGERGAERRITGTDNNHIRSLTWHFSVTFFVVIREGG